jgi:hypothetical protein
MKAWNYRVATKMVNDTRIFKIIECHYDENNEVEGYNDNNPNILDNWTDIKELIATYYMIESAFELPIIDLDNFPNYYRIVEALKNEDTHNGKDL